MAGTGIDYLSILPHEIWVIILEMLCPKPGELISPEARIGLSEESFAPGVPPPSAEQSPEDILLNLVHACPQFSSIGRSRLYVRVSTRFRSFKDFERLEYIADKKNMAEHVQQFSYMIPRFFAYPEGLDSSRFEAILETARGETAVIQRQMDRLLGSGQPPSSSFAIDRQASQLSPLRKKHRSCKVREEHIEKIAQKAANQRYILQKRLDVTCLLHAFKRFPKLQQIRLMPLNEDADFGWERYLDTHPDLAPELRPSMADSFRHGAQTLTAALLESGSNASRFSSRSMDLGTLTLPPADSLRTTMRSVAERFTTLDLQFVYRDNNIDDRLRALSGLFLLVFHAAVNLRCLHVGFGGRRVSIPLELVFHDVPFRYLYHLGIHEWRLHSGELIKLLDRHKHTLRSVRLRHVSLKEETPPEDGHWKKVLQFIRMNLKLNWVSLRGVYYNNNTLNLGGMQFGNMIYGRPPDGDSDDEDDFDADDLEDNWSLSNDSEGLDLDDETEETTQNGIHEDGGLHEDNTEAIEDDDRSDDSESTTVGDQVHDGLEDSTDESNDEHDDGMSDLDEHHDLTQVDSPTMAPQQARNSESPCYCDEGFAWINLREDNGHYVTKQQWKRWELWIMKRCQRGHDPTPETQT